MLALWDPHKAASNFTKHGIRFSDAESVLFDPLAITIEDSTAGGEQRFVTLGEDALRRALVLVFTQSDTQVRLISARRATKNERRRYEEGV